jgi:hypothetical protein
MSSQVKKTFECGSLSASGLMLLMRAPAKDEPRRSRRRLNLDAALIAIALVANEVEANGGRPELFWPLLVSTRSDSFR